MLLYESGRVDQPFDVVNGRLLALGLGWLEETARQVLLQVSASAANEEDAGGAGEAVGDLQVCTGPPEATALTLTIPVSFTLGAASGEQVLQGQLEVVWLNRQETQLGLTLSYQFSHGTGLLSHRSVQVAIDSFLDRLKMTLASLPPPAPRPSEHPA
jgi:hypothetical protein